jgi:hypothetical protein
MATIEMRLTVDQGKTICDASCPMWKVEHCGGGLTIGDRYLGCAFFDLKTLKTEYNGEV